MGDAARVWADGRLDVRGESCPYPELYTLEALDAIGSGKVLEVITDCPQSFIRIPESVRVHGHALLSERRDGTTRVYYIRAR
ncbi:sulfurtransferase-like selenium metabolism protein YedF [Alicyclobacillus sp.]|uniref:sulfurtransferase-like selenium metabolism protein YedF n=1 Tax=Alicyclobacillus sp. TaxID=61169 RepID=UPI0025C62062|nr:sulfurtransferase-like selenium metabolism protein YedF [Alicyclobacillus sp.]MCL6516817.1 sulfurtransferase-like selenium metabolism protein YedF [Alicyclobacillus sp.]